MPKISALKILDEAILPVVIVVGAKIFSIFLWTLILGFPWDFGFKQNSYQLLFISFQNFEHLFIVNNISDFTLLVVAAIGFNWIIFRSIHFAEENTHPSKKALLFRLGRQEMLVNNHEIFHQASVWLALSWFTIFVVLNNVLTDVTSGIVLAFGMTVTIILTLVLYLNLKKLSR